MRSNTVNWSVERAFHVVEREAPLDSLSCFDTFAALPSNLTAYRLAMSFSLGQRSFALLQGASGWGKSHLCHSAGEHVGARVYSAEEWLSERRLMERTETLIIDDIHRAMLRPKSMQLLRFELERRVRAKRPTLCAAAPSPVSPVRKLLPFRRHWQVATIEEPSSDERKQIVASMCENRGLDLSPRACALIARLVKGDGHSLLGALARLKVASMEERDMRQMHPIRLTGLLHPYLIDQIDFDLRDVVLDAVTQCPDRPACHGERDAVRTLGLAVLILTDLAGMSESSVATYFGIKPGYLYKLKQGVSRSLDQPDQALRIQLDRVLSHVTRTLSGD